MAGIAGKFDIVNFLELYQEFPCLWNKSNADYKLRGKRDLAEQSILNNIEGVENIKTLRLKIRSIRGTYNNELRKIKCSMTTGSAEIYKPKLHWFKIAHSFLSNSQKCDENETNLTLNSTSRVFSSAQISTRQNNTFANEDTSSTTEGDEDVPTRKPKRKKADRGLEEAVQILKQIRKEVTEKSENEFHIFAKHVGAQLKEMSLRTALITQKKIQDLLTEARLNDLEYKVKFENKEL